MLPPSSSSCTRAHELCSTRFGGSSATLLPTGRCGAAASTGCAASSISPPLPADALFRQVVACCHCRCQPLPVGPPCLLLLWHATPVLFMKLPLAPSPPQPRPLPLAASVSVPALFYFPSKASSTPQAGEARPSARSCGQQALPIGDWTLFDWQQCVARWLLPKCGCGRSGQARLSASDMCSDEDDVSGRKCRAMRQRLGHMFALWCEH